MTKKLQCAFLISGGGTTFQNMMHHIREDKVDAEIKVIVSSRPNVKGLERAGNWKIPTEVIEYKKYSDIDKFSNDVTAALEKYKPIDLIIMGGWMCFYKLPDKYIGKVINVHPALIPAFAGDKMYGDRVHRAVIERGVKVTGCSVHFVDNIYDNGPILLQSTVPVEENDTPETLAARVQAEERKILPRAVQLIAEGKVEIVGRKTRIKK